MDPNIAGIEKKVKKEDKELERQVRRVLEKAGSIKEVLIDSSQKKFDVDIILKISDRIRSFDNEYSRLEKIEKEVVDKNNEMLSRLIKITSMLDEKITKLPQKEYDYKVIRGVFSIIKLKMKAIEELLKKDINKTIELARRNGGYFGINTSLELHELKRKVTDKGEDIIDKIKSLYMMEEEVKNHKKIFQHLKTAANPETPISIEEIKASISSKKNQKKILKEISAFLDSELEGMEALHTISHDALVYLADVGDKMKTIKEMIRESARQQWPTRWILENKDKISGIFEDFSKIDKQWRQKQDFVEGLSKFNASA